MSAKSWSSLYFAKMACILYYHVLYNDPPEAPVSDIYINYENEKSSYELTFRHLVKRAGPRERMADV